MKNYFRIITLSVFLLLHSISTLSAQKKEEGKLAQFENEVEKQSESRNNSDSNSSDNYDSSGDEDCYYDDDDDFDFFLFIEMSKATVVGLRNVLFISDYEKENGFAKTAYSEFPYCGNSDGLFDKSSSKKYSVYSNLNYFRQSSNLTALNFNARLSPSPSFSFEINYSDFTEKLRTRYDHLRMYDVFINYNRLKFENFAFWWGLGFKGFTGDRRHGAIAINLGTNIFLPNTPVSFALNYNVGFFESTNIYDFTPKIRYHIDRAEISLGYRLYQAGNISIKGLTLGLGFYL